MYFNYKHKVSPYSVFGYALFRLALPSGTPFIKEAVPCLSQRQTFLPTFIKGAVPCLSQRHALLTFILLFQFSPLIFL